MDQSSFSVTITMLPGSVGTWTVWGLIPASECGDSAILTVTAATVPNTAARPVALPVPELLGALLLLLGAASVPGLRRTTIR